MKIAILDDYQDAVRKLDCFTRLAAARAHEIKVFNNTVKGVGQLAARLADVEALVLIRERTRLPRPLLERLPKLRVIAQTGRVASGADAHLDVATCTQRGIAVLESAGDPVAPAELTWALIMAAQRRLPQYIGNLKHGAWQQSGLKAATMPANFGLGTVLRGQTLGIWGFGRIGALVADFGRAFGMRVLVWGSDAGRARARAAGYETADSRAQLFASADVLSLHLRLADATRGVVTLDDLVQMKPTALFVNTSRAELVADNALVAALNRGRPGIAAVDVFESEPILQGHALLRLENCICTPHIGFVERNSYEQYFGAAFDQLLAFAAGDTSAVMNPDALRVVR